MKSGWQDVLVVGSLRSSASIPVLGIQVITASYLASLL